MNDTDRLALNREVHSLFRPGFNDSRTAAEVWDLLGHRYQGCEIRRVLGWLVRRNLLSRPKNKAGGKIERRYNLRRPWPERKAA